MAYLQGTPPMPPPPARKLSTGAIVAIVVGGVLALICGICGIGVVATRDQTAPAQPTKSQPAVTVTAKEPVPVVTKDPVVTRAAAPPTSEPAKMLTMPDGLVGSNALIVQGKLKDAGFTNIHFGSGDPNDTVVILPQNWRVTKVEPGPGTSVRADEPIVITCTKQR